MRLPHFPDHRFATIKQLCQLDNASSNSDRVQLADWKNRKMEELFNTVVNTKHPVSNIAVDILCEYQDNQQLYEKYVTFHLTLLNASV